MCWIAPDFDALAFDPIARPVGGAGIFSESLPIGTTGFPTPRSTTPSGMATHLPRPEVISGEIKAFAVDATTTLMEATA